MELRRSDDSTGWLDLVVHKGNAPSNPGALAVSDSGLIADESAVSFLRIAARNATDVVFVTDTRLNVLWTSPSTERLLARPAEDLLGTGALDLVHPEDIPELTRKIAAAIEDRQQAHYRFRWLRGTGEYDWFEGRGGAYEDNEGMMSGFVVQARDISDQVRLEEALNHAARHDSLTGLSNRAEALDQIDRICSGQQRTGTHDALLFCDLDEFKAVNDTHGHAAGDEVLRTIADRIRACLRSTDTAARLGGDEFVVILRGVHDLGDAVRVAQTMLERASRPIHIGDAVEFTVSMSIGVALVNDQDGAAQVLAQADAAMFEAKRNGRNQVVTLDDQTH